MTPVYLRHPNATRQSLVMGVLALISGFLAVVGWFNNTGSLRWMALALAIPALVFAYFFVRTATLRVRLDDEGVWEPNPFRLTFVTPWADIRQIRKSLSHGRVRFVGVQVVYNDGVERDITALMMQAGAAGSEDAVAAWVEAVREAKRAAKR